MLKTIERAILKELLITFLISVVSFNFIFMMEKVLKMTRLLSSVGADLIDMLKIIIFVQPMLLILTTPLSFLITVLITYGRLSMDNELLVMRVCGMSFSAVSRPVRVFGFLCFIISLLFSFYISPLSSRLLSRTVSSVISERTPLAIEEGVFNTTFTGIIMHIGKKTSSDKFQEIFIYDERDKKQPVTLFAEDGSIYTGNSYSISFSLTNGFIHLPKGDASTELFFQRYKFTLPLPVKGFSRKKAELTPLELLRESKKTEGVESIRILLEFHRRLSFPLLCLVLILGGPLLALISGRGGRLAGLTIGLLAFAIYYMVLIYGERLSMAGNLPHYIGAWLPLIIGGAISIFIFRKVNSR